jgi:hypothetical protein
MHVPHHLSLLTTCCSLRPHMMDIDCQFCAIEGFEEEEFDDDELEDEESEDEEPDAEELNYSSRNDSNRTLSHKPCRACEEAETQDTISLCDRCLHLRLRHRLLHPNDQIRDTTTEITSSLKLSLSRTKNECALCQYLASFMDVDQGDEEQSFKITLQFNENGTCTFFRKELVVTNLYADVPARPVHCVRDYIDWDRLWQDLETWGRSRVEMRATHFRTCVSSTSTRHASSVFRTSHTMWPSPTYGAKAPRTRYKHRSPIAPRTSR